MSDTSPLFNLSAINQLHLLRLAFDKILVPEAVLRELEPVREHPATQAVRRAIDQAWIVVKPVSDHGRVRVLEQDLGRGEAAAITLALELDIRRILIDERDGSRVALQLGLEPLGVLGILLRAKLEGQQLSMKELMTSLRDEVGFYIDRNLFERVLHLAGEG